MRHDIEGRKTAIIQQVERWPGSNLRQVGRATGIPLSTTARLLDQLVNARRLRLDQRSNYNHYYPAGKGLHKRERVVLGTVAKPRPRALLETILAEPGIRHSDLAAKVKIPPPTATYYLKQLVAKDLVVVRANGIQRHFRIKNPDMLEAALKRTAKGYDPKMA